MSDRQFYNLSADEDEEVYNDHIETCACCGGQTEEMGDKLAGDYGDVYRCEVCKMRISSVNGLIEVYAEPRRVDNVLKDKYPQYNWGGSRA